VKKLLEFKADANAQVLNTKRDSYYNKLSTSARRKVGGTGKLGRRAHAACFRQNQANWEYPWKIPWHPLRFFKDLYRGSLLLPTYTIYVKFSHWWIFDGFRASFFAPNPRHAPRPENPACHPPRRVLKNMAKSVAMDGGNFYKEE